MRAMLMICGPPDTGSPLSDIAAVENYPAGTLSEKQEEGCRPALTMH